MLKAFVNNQRQFSLQSHRFIFGDALSCPEARQQRIRPIETPAVMLFATLRKQMELNSTA